MRCHHIVFIVLSLFTNAIAEEPVICRNLLLTYDVAKLEAELNLIEDKFMPRRPPYENWTGIPLRNFSGTDEQKGLEIGYSIENQKMQPCKNSSFLKQLPYISFILEDIAQKFDAEIGLVRISKLMAHNKINTHNDGKTFDIDKGTISRLHIPIITGVDVLFRLANKNYQFEPGTLYYTNVSKKHSVLNNGPIDRVHLLIDVETSKALHAHILASPEVAPQCS